MEGLRSSVASLASMTSASMSTMETLHTRVDRDGNGNIDRDELFAFADRHTPSLHSIGLPTEGEYPAPTAWGVAQVAGCVLLVGSALISSRWVMWLLIGICLGVMQMMYAMWQLVRISLALFVLGTFNFIRLVWMLLSRVVECLACRRCHDFQNMHTRLYTPDTYAEWRRVAEAIERQGDEVHRQGCLQAKKKRRQAEKRRTWGEMGRGAVGWGARAAASGAGAGGSGGGGGGGGWRDDGNGEEEGQGTEAPDSPRADACADTSDPMVALAMQLRSLRRSGDIKVRRRRGGRRACVYAVLYFTLVVCGVWYCVPPPHSTHTHTHTHTKAIILCHSGRTHEIFSMGYPPLPPTPFTHFAHTRPS